ncbi:hypothetical protein B0T14DRAFT_520964 [Immersiella caudata]|uniref:Uncharacterized protein n=1 Tax=Immersiella caudata TaxID=314043 RepID=A0AA40C0E8_9PEZI|nr:hypothetical protein B0T14DRAFT_520964 [Immersiella caudata]
MYVRSTQPSQTAFRLQVAGVLLLGQVCSARGPHWTHRNLACTARDGMLSSNRACYQPLLKLQHASPVAKGTRKTQDGWPNLSNLRNTAIEVRLSGTCRRKPCL